MKKVAILFLGFVISVNLNAQVTWSKDIAPILYDKCVSCHNPAGIGTFSLINYPSAQQYSSLIDMKVQNNEMPPWSPDTIFQRFLHERVLSQTEKQKIADWVNQGAQQGDPNLAPPPPTYPVDGILGTPDLKVTMPVYTSKATSTSDDYICVAVPTGLTTNKKIRAIEVVPGNRNIVHHSLIFIDPTGNYVSDTVGGDCGGPTSGFLATGYAPGGQPTVFPNGGGLKTGIDLPAGSSVILAMHYPEGSAGEKDSTSVHFFFYDDTVTTMRPITADRLIQNWTFCIPANTVRTVSDWYPSSSTGVSQDYSILSVLPHMHLIGTSIESYALDTNGDTIPFVRIPHWDFEWQDFYFFKKPQKLSQGSRIYGEGVYDNRPGNHHNPNNPPITICAGLNTTDEMFIVYFHYMDYEPGDENLNLDSLMTASLSNHIYKIDQKKNISVFPNPFDSELVFNYKLDNAAFVNLVIYDLNGRIVSLPIREKQGRGSHFFKWNGLDRKGQAIAKGVYNYSLKIDDKVYSGRLVRQ